MTERYSTKAGRENHSVLEPAFFYGLSLVGKMLRGRGIVHAVYGGVGAQIYIAKAVAGDRPIDQIDSLSTLTRKTSDYDIAIPEDVKDSELEAAVGAFVGKDEYGRPRIFDEMPPGGNYLFQTRLKRAGSRRPVLSILDYDIQESSEGVETIVHVTFDKDKPHHTEMARQEGSKIIQLNHSKVGEVSVMMAPVEYILAGKLGRGNPKDVEDSFRLVNLYTSMDIEIVKDVAKRMSVTETKDDKTFYSHLGNIDSLKAYLEGKLADLDD